MDDAIKTFLETHYDGSTEKIDMIAKKLHVSRSTVKHWACQLRLTKPMERRRRPWTDKEDSYLEQHYTLKKPSDIARSLHRSIYDVAERATMLGITKLGEGCDIERLCEVLDRDYRTIHKYIRAGWLKYQKRNTDRRNDYYYFSYNDIREFLVKHPDVMNTERMDAARMLWLIDTVYGGRHGIGELTNKVTQDHQSQPEKPA